jgi:hypothetical protein
LLRTFAIAVVVASALAGSAGAQAFPPDGPNIPAIANTEDASGAAGQTIATPPPPKAWDQESAWNMQVEGFNDNQGRPIYQPLVVDQNGREILYLGNLTGNLLNPLTGKVEPNGTSIIDVTDVKHTKFLFHIPGPSGDISNAGAQMVRVCSGDVLPHGEKGKWYLLRAFGNAGPDESHQIWDVTDPAAPKFVTTVVSGLSNTHKSWWECDTGIAYLVAGSKSDGWQQSGSAQHLKIYDLSDPRHPVYIRDFGLVGQEPGADVKTAQSCTAAPRPNCYEGTKNSTRRRTRADLNGDGREQDLFALRRRQGWRHPDCRPAKTVEWLQESDRLDALRGKSDAGGFALSASRRHRHESREWRAQFNARTRRADAAGTSPLCRRYPAKEESADRELGRHRQ